MDLLDRLLGHDAWTTRQLLLRCRGLTDEQLDRRFDIGHETLRGTLVHIIGNLEVWTDLLHERPVRPDAATASAQPSARWTSSGAAMARPPAAAISSATTRALSSKRSATQTTAPSAAKSRAWAPPIAPPPPVISATLPRSFIDRLLSPPRSLGTAARPRGRSYYVNARWVNAGDPTDPPPAESGPIIPAFHATVGSTTGNRGRRSRPRSPCTCTL